MADERSRIFDSISLRDVGRNRRRRTLDLRGEAKRLFPRKDAREPVALLRQFHGFLPDPQIPVGVDRFAQYQSPFATRSSLPTILHSPLTTHCFAFSSPGRT